MTELRWYRRLADVPGVDYAGVGIDRQMLPGHDARPVVTREYEWDGERHQIVEWQWPDGSSQWSPSRERELSADEPHSPAERIRNLHEKLELPGELADYHFAIAGTAAVLWGERWEHPQLIETVEELYCLDIALVEAHPETVAYERDDETAYYSVPAYESLISLYEQQGYVREALELAERAARFGHGEHARKRLEAKLEALEAEGRD